MQMCRKWRVLASLMGVLLITSASSTHAENAFNVDSILGQFQGAGSVSLNATLPMPDRVSKSGVSNNQSVISQIQVVGNQSVASADILAVTGFSVPLTVSAVQIDRAVAQIKAMGVFDTVNATLKPVKGVKSGGNILEIKVSEAPKIGAIRFSGIHTIPTSDLEGVVRLKPGDVLNRAQLRADIGAIRDVLQAKGYLYASVYDTSTLQKNGDDLVFYISEGTIGEIVVSGNERTQAYVILRELELKVGDPIVQDRIKADLRAVYNTNFFNDVRPEFLPGDRPRTYKLRIVVEERPAGTLSFGGGYGDRSNWFIYSDVKWTNVMGTGQTIGLKGQLGKTSSGEFSYFNPWAWGKRNSLLVKLWRTSGQFDAFGSTSQYSLRNEVRTGAEVGVRTPITSEVSLSHTGHVEKIQPSDSISSAYGLLSYRFGVSYDTRDVWFNPSSGAFHSFYYTKGFSWFGATEYQRFDVELRQFIPTFEKQTIALRLDLGRITDNPISTETYFVGGQSSVRGYNETDPSEVLVGRNQVVGSLEYRFLFSDSFQLVFFQDVGTASETFNDLLSSRNYIAGRGAGIRLTTPLGPLRFDLGFPTTGSMRIHFGIGNQF